MHYPLTLRTQLFKNKAKLCIWHACKSVLRISHKYDKTFEVSTMVFPTEYGSFIQKQNLFRFLNASIHWYNNKVHFELSVSFFLKQLLIT